MLLLHNRSLTAEALVNPLKTVNHLSPSLVLNRLVERGALLPSSSSPSIAKGYQHFYVQRRQDSVVQAACRLRKGGAEASMTSIKMAKVHDTSIIEVYIFHLIFCFLSLYLKRQFLR